VFSISIIIFPLTSFFGAMSCQHQAAVVCASLGSLKIVYDIVISLSIRASTIQMVMCWFTFGASRIMAQIAQR
jgi:hypothetical protein